MQLAGDHGLEQRVLQLAEAADLDLAAVHVIPDPAQLELEAQAGQGGEQAALADHRGLVVVDAHGDGVVGRHRDLDLAELARELEAIHRDPAGIAGRHRR